jgi:hypothetical protein
LVGRLSRDFPVLLRPLRMPARTLVMLVQRLQRQPLRPRMPFRTLSVLSQRGRLPRLTSYSWRRNSRPTGIGVTWAFVERAQ